MLSSAKPSKILTLSPDSTTVSEVLVDMCRVHVLTILKWRMVPWETAGKAEVVLQARLSRKKGVWSPHVVLGI